MNVTSGFYEPFEISMRWEEEGLDLERRTDGVLVGVIDALVPDWHR